jgi:hypothetical protein
MMITPNILSIPPYISTAWKNIASLHVEPYLSGPVLIVALTNGKQIEIPRLDKDSLKAIFKTHAHYLEMEQTAQSKKPAPLVPGMDLFTASFKLPLETPFNTALNMENMGAVLQHNPEQSDAPDLPPELVGKIAALAQTIGISDPDAIPQAEPHCNCTHCQIARALHKGFEEKTEMNALDEEIVTDEDLTFRTWDIHQAGDKLYTVQNPLDAKEQYSVFLGEPVGCTCGEKHCEHVEAVLKS